MSDNRFLDLNWKVLVDNLKTPVINQILDQLRSKVNLSHEEYATVFSYQGNDYDKVRTLLPLVSSRGEPTIDAFKEALKELNPGLYECLEHIEDESETTDKALYSADRDHESVESGSRGIGGSINIGTSSDKTGDAASLKVRKRAGTNGTPSLSAKVPKPSHPSDESDCEDSSGIGGTSPSSSGIQSVEEAGLSQDDLSCAGYDIYSEDITEGELQKKIEELEQRADVLKSEGRMQEAAQVHLEIYQHMVRHGKGELGFRLSLLSKQKVHRLQEKCENGEVQEVIQQQIERSAEKNFDLLKTKTDVNVSTGAEEISIADWDQGDQKCQKGQSGTIKVHAERVKLKKDYVHQKGNKGAVDDFFDHLVDNPDELDPVIQYLNSFGVQVQKIKRGCIELKFCCLTTESTDKLRREYKNDQLHQQIQNLMDESALLEHFGLESVLVDVKCTFSNEELEGTKPYCRQNTVSLCNIGHEIQNVAVRGKRGAGKGCTGNVLMMPGRRSSMVMGPYKLGDEGAEPHCPGPSITQPPEPNLTPLSPCTSPEPVTVCETVNVHPEAKPEPSQRLSVLQSIPIARLQIGRCGQEWCSGKPRPLGGSTDDDDDTRAWPLPCLEECKMMLKHHGIENFLQSCATQLCKKFPIPWYDKVAMDAKDTFTTIDILPYNETFGQLQQLLESVTDIFKSRPDCKNPRRIVLWGEPGIGKTTILAKLVREWTEDAETLQQFDLVFPIALGRVQRTQSLVDSIFDQLLPEDHSFSKQDLKEYLQGNKKVLILLDGYDEWQPEESHDITKLITGAILPDCSLVVATRTVACTSDILIKMTPDTRLELLGFSPDNVKSYILKFFKDDPAQGEALLEKIGPVLKTGILSVPILLMQICFLWEDKKDILLSDKVCLVYDQLVSYLLTRCTKDKNPVSEVDNQVEDMKTLYCALGKMSLEHLLKMKFVFNEEAVHRYCGDGHKMLVQSGLLMEKRSPSRLDPIVRYSFSHKTMQEYFAAQYLSELEEATKREILHQHLGSVRMILTFSALLIFTCGKLGQGAKFVLNHLLEIHSKSDVQLVEEEFYNFFKTGRSKKDWNKDIKLENFAMQQGLTSQFAGQWNNYSQVLLRYQSYIELFLLCCHESGLTAQFAEQIFQRDAIQFSSASPRVYSVLPHMIAGLSVKMRKIEHLRLLNTQNDVLGSLRMILEKLPKFSGLTELNLRQSRLGTHLPKCRIPRRLELLFSYRRLMETSEDDLAKAPTLLAEKLCHLRSLKKLNISWNNLGPKDMKQLLPAIQKLTNLEELFLSGNDLGGLGKDIADLMAFLPKLKEFKVYFCQLSLKELLMIALSLTKCCPDLQLFDFQLNPIQPDGSIWIGGREVDMVRATLGSAVFLPSGVEKLPPLMPIQGQTPPTLHGKLRAIPMRDYQMELAKPALEGWNTIICAPMGSGKTHVAIKITREHLEGATAIGADVDAERRVVFLVNRVPLVEQKCIAFREYLSPKYNILPLSGETAADIPVGETLPKHDIIILTAQVLENALRDGLITLDTFSMLIVDECHHCQKNDPYNAIMTRYIKQKWEESSTRLPQIIGLTASLGVGRANSQKDAVEHILKSCANLDTEWLSQVVEHKDELLGYNQKQDEEVKAVSRRSEDPFANKLNKIMEDIEKTIEKTLAVEASKHLTQEDMKPPQQRETQAYEQWLVTLAGKGATLMDDSISRVIHAATNHLRIYSNALAINADARMKDALEYLDRFMAGLQREGFDSTDEYLVKLFAEAKMELQEYAADPKYSNPKLDQLKSMILQAYEEKPDSRCLLFCKTRVVCYGVLMWMQEDEALCKLNPGRLVSAAASESTGGMTQNQQVELLERFTTGGHKIVISTSAAEEGIDISKCNFVFRYDYVGNEIGKVQTKGRGHAECSKSVLIAGREGGNVLKEKEKLMEKAMLQVWHMQRENHGDFMKEVRRLQLESKKKRGLAQALKELERKVRGNGMKLLCIKCKQFACNASDIRRINKNHHVVVDKSFANRVIIRPHPPKKIDDWEMIGKVYCKNCRLDWGIQMVYEQASFPTLTIESFVLEKPDGMRLTCRKWKKAPFEVDDITPDDIQTLVNKDEVLNICVKHSTVARVSQTYSI